MGCILPSFDRSQSALVDIINNEQIVLFSDLFPWRSESKVLFAEQSEWYQSYIDLAVDVYKTQDYSSVQSLKNFLNCLPSPTIIEAVLAAAIAQLASIDIDTYQWILLHPDYFLPELDLVYLARKCMQLRLESQGLILGRDFQFTEQYELNISHQIKSHLWPNIPLSERLLFEALLPINESR